MHCRHCSTPLSHVFLDLGKAPPSNNYVRKEDLQKPEITLPLRLFVCDNCWLVQTEDFAAPEELFSSDYAYFSSMSQNWLDHAARYTQAMTKRLSLNKNSFVIEVASNDGYLLKNFIAAGIPCLGIEPTASTAEAAEKLGVPVKREFFGAAMAKSLPKADLILGNNVYAHVPDINDFTLGLKTALKPGGTVTLEFPHLMRLIEDTQFDTVYHEHYSYLSLYSVRKIFEKAGLKLIDVEQLPTHGGSLRVYGAHVDDVRTPSPTVGKLLAEEERFGLRGLNIYQAFQARADHVRDGLLAFLKAQKQAGKTVMGYGAAAKGNTLLNYAGVGADLLSCVFDTSPSKQGKHLPGSHIPILAPDSLQQKHPDFLLVLPWNLKDEIMKKTDYIRGWGGKFVVAVPAITIT